MEVCLSWLANIRGHLVSIALHAGLPGVALRHGFAALENLSSSVHVSRLCERKRGWERERERALEIVLISSDKISLLEQTC